MQDDKLTGKSAKHEHAPHLAQREKLISARDQTSATLDALRGAMTSAGRRPYTRSSMPLEVKIRPPLGLATTRTLVDELAAGEVVPSAESMDQLVKSALALRHAAHLTRAIAPWLPTLSTNERTAVEALLRSLTLESAEDSDGRIDDHGGYRGGVSYELIGAARVIRLEHRYGYNNLEMQISTSLNFEDLGPSPALAKVRKNAAKPLESERFVFESPMDPAPAADMLFTYLGAEEALSRETRVRLLLRLLFPWGRYLHGYDGVTEAFYEDADRLYSLSRARRARELKARDDDGEIIPFFLG